MNSKIILMIMLLFGSLNYVTGQEVEAHKPSLNGHTFIPVSLINSSFINTKLTMPIGIGTTRNFDFDPEVPGLDTLDGLTGEILFANLGFRYSQKVQDWISFYFRLGLTARLGTNFESILSQGFNTVVSFKIGSMIKLYESNKTRLSLSVGVQNYDANFVDIKGFAEDIIAGRPEPRIVRKVPALTTGGGLHFAWGINDIFGIRLESTYAYGETFTRGHSGGLYAIKGGVDIDFNNRFKVPIGLAFNLAVTTEPEIVYVDHRTGKMFFWKIAYTGRKDFDIGIETGIMELPFENLDEKPRIEMVSMTMSYFFN